MIPSILQLQLLVTLNISKLANRYHIRILDEVQLTPVT